MPPSTVGRGTCAAVAGIPTGERPATYIVMIPPGTTSMGTGGEGSCSERSSALGKCRARGRADKHQEHDQGCRYDPILQFHGKLLGGFTCATTLAQNSPQWP